jgi:dienelactone hydrolase
MCRWTGLLGCVLWVTGTVVARMAAFGDVDASTVQLHLADGTAIHGTLYRGRSPASASPAAIVLHGTALTHSSCAPGLAVPLARVGFAVLAIDLRGHGRTGGSLPRSEYDKMEAMLASSPEQPEVDAAIQFLRTLPGVDAGRLALVGVSRGGWMATTVAAHRDDVACAIAVSSAPTNCDSRSPKNLLFLVGGFDQCIPWLQCQKAFDNATSGHGTPGETIGEFGRGTARQMTLSPWSTHLSMMADASTMRRAVQWAAWSVGRDPGPVPAGRLYVAVVAVALASLGGLLTLIGVGSIVAVRLLPAASDSPRSAQLFAVAALLLLPFSASWIAGRVGSCLPDGGVLFSSGAFVVMLAMGAFALLAGLLVRAPRPARVSGFSPAASWRGVLAGLLMASTGLTVFGVTWGSTWLDLSPTPNRLCVACLLLLLFLPCGLALSSGVQRVLGQTSATRSGAASRGLVWLGMAATLWIGYVTFARTDYPFQGIPLFFIVLSSFIPLPLWLLADRPGLCVARGVSHALTVAAFLAWHLPFVHSG